MEIDFDNPNEKLKSFALKENLDLNDLQVQKYFLQMKKKIIDEINEFHEKNLDLMKNQNENNKKLLNNIKKINKEKGFKSESEEENEMFMKKEIENIDDKDFKKIKNSIIKNNLFGENIQQVNLLFYIIKYFGYHFYFYHVLQVID